MKIYNAISGFVLVVVMVFGSRMAANYFAVQTNLDPWSKSTSFLTLLFMLCFFLGVFLTSIVNLMRERIIKKKDR